MQRVFNTLLVAAAAFAVYLPALGNGFALDDLIHIVHNPALRGSHPLHQLFLSPMYPGDLYRPLTMLSFALTERAAGLEAYYFHLINILLHSFVSVLVLSLMPHIGIGRLALPIALLFALHPLHVEVAANVMGRSELLAAAFMLSGLLVTMAAPSRARLGALAALFAAALLSKESAATMLLIAPLIWARQQSPEVKLRSYGSLLLAVFAAYLMCRYQVTGALPQGEANQIKLDNPLIDLPLIERLPIALALLGKYLVMHILPFPLSADYSYALIAPEHFWKDVSNWLHLTIVLAVLAAAVAALRTAPALHLLGLWFFAAFAITANVFFPIGTIFAERLAYLPGIGAVGFVAVALSRYAPRALAGVVFASATLFFVYSAATHAPIWRNNESLYEYQITTSPESAKTQANYAVVLRNRGDLRGADLHFRQALAIYPNFANAAYGIGSVYAAKGLLSGAEHWFYEALKLQPTHIDSLLALGKLYLRAKRFDDSREKFRAALQASPGSYDARLGMLALALEENDEKEGERLRLELEAEDPYNAELKALTTIPQS